MANMNRSLILLFLFVNICQSGRIRREGGGKCTTPRSEAGECRNIKYCPVLLQLVKSDDQSSIDLLRESNCGFEDKDPLVCCPELRPIDEVPNRAPSQQCGRNSVGGERVTDGNEVTLGTLPWMAALGYRYTYTKFTGYEWNCGGTLITDKHVVTAGHCVIIPSGKTLSVVRLGELDLNDTVNDGASPKDMGIEKIIPHPQYMSKRKVNDIAIIKLNDSVKFNDYMM